MPIPVEQPPYDTDPELIAYLNRLVISINTQLEADGKLTKRTQLPSSPVEAKVYYFSVPIAPDITAKGYWVYEDGTWQSLL